MSGSPVIGADGFVGTPSDEVPGVLAAGRGGITTLFVSMARRHPEGGDAEYLRWHTLDHRPEQHRLASLRASLRVMSTPACRAARAVSEEPFDAIDHVMSYFFDDSAGLGEFDALSRALGAAGRVPFVLAPVQRGVYTVAGRFAAPRVKAGADVLPWWPARGVYLLLEQGAAGAAQLAGIPGVAGVWSANAVASGFSTADVDQQISYLFLDDDPVATAARLRPALELRWQRTGVRPLLAAPFHSLVPWAWDRHLP